VPLSLIEIAEYHEQLHQGTVYSHHASAMRADTAALPDEGVHQDPEGQTFPTSQPSCANVPARLLHPHRPGHLPAQHADAAIIIDNRARPLTTRHCHQRDAACPGACRRHKPVIQHQPYAAIVHRDIAWR
jgi:hypothetical protein